MKNKFEKRGDHYAIFANGDERQHEILVDKEDFKEVAAFRGTWYVRKDGNTFYAQTTIRSANGKWKTVKMHRILLNPPTDMQVDHKNHNGLDNRRENIRVVTCGENNRNRIDNVEFQSDVDGVTWNSGAQAWQAYPQVNGKQIHLGFFDEERIAVAAKLMYLETGMRVKQSDPRRTAEFQSDVPGVSWNSRAQAWWAYPRVNGKQIHLGYFDKERIAEAAKLMYLETGMRVKRSRKNRRSGNICSRKGLAL